MSKRKRPHSPSSSLPASLPARPAVDACWYFAAGGCSRPSCPFSHRSYCDLIVDYSARRAVKDDDRTRALWSRRDRFQHYFGETSPDRWTAVMPVPLIYNAWIAFHHPLFLPAITAVMRRASEATDTEPSATVLLADKNYQRLWGSVVLQGRREQVERGEEAFIALMEQGYYRSGDTRLLHYMQPQTAQQWQSHEPSAATSPARSNSAGTEQSSTESSAGSVSPAAVTTEAAAVLSSSDESQPEPSFVPVASSSSRAAPCVQHLTRGICARPECPLLHEPYSVLFARAADTSPTSKPARKLGTVSRSFKPKLAPLTLSEPHRNYVVSLPLPCIPAYNSPLIGQRASHCRFITNYCSLAYCRFGQALPTKAERTELTRRAEAGYGWLAVNGEGTAQNVDRLLECMFWLVDRVRIDRWLNSDETIEQLQRHMNEWEKARFKTELSEGEFFAFKSRAIPFRVPTRAQPFSPSASSSASVSSSAPASPLSPVSATNVLSPAATKTPSRVMCESPTFTAPSLASPPTDTTAAIDTDIPLPPMDPPPTSLFLQSTVADEVTVAARLAMALADMHTAGLTVTHNTMNALFDDHCLAASPQCVPFIRLLPAAQFACLPLPLDSMSRPLLIAEPFDPLPICADIEQETGVDLYVPPLPLDGGADNSASVMCNVQFNVLAVHERSTQQLEDAVLQVMMRWEAVKQYLTQLRASDTVLTNGVH